MSTVTPRSADTFEVSSSRRELFCLVEDCSVGVSYRAQAPVMRAPFSFVGLGHSGKRMGVLSQAACIVWYGLCLLFDGMPSPRSKSHAKPGNVPLPLRRRHQSWRQLFAGLSRQRCWSTSCILQLRPTLHRYLSLLLTAPCPIQSPLRQEPVDVLPRWRPSDLTTRCRRP